MADEAEVDDRGLPAGEFSAWARETVGAVRGERAADVPCAGCTACCRAAQFVHIAPDEHDTLARIPAALRFPAPRMPHGHVLLGYDERGHCPMLVNDRCSIYEHRPRTCRAYDCRVLAASGVDVDVDDATKDELMQRVRAWRFSYASPDSRARHLAVRAAARFLAEHASELPDGAVPPSATQRSGLALELHETFLGRDAEGTLVVVAPDLAAVRAALERRRAGGGSIRRAPTRG